MEAAERQGLATPSYQGAMVDIAMVKTAQQMLVFVKAVGMQVGHY
jgi:citrate lyase beta subunit